MLGLLDPEELLVQLPEWLAEKKVESADRTTPTVFVGYISTETADAIRFEASAPAQPLLGLAHRMHSLEKGINRTESGTDRYERLTNRFQEHERKFYNRDRLPSRADKWLPKSQIGTAVRRRA